jgi:hypothetical protein
MKVTATTVMDAVAADPHHGGITEWGVLGKELYTRAKSFPRPKWVKVNRVSYTPKRILLFATLLAISS